MYKLAAIHTSQPDATSTSSAWIGRERGGSISLIEIQSGFAGRESARTLGRKSLRSSHFAALLADLPATSLNYVAPGLHSGTWMLAAAWACNTPIKKCRGALPMREWLRNSSAN